MAEKNIERPAAKPQQLCMLKILTDATNFDCIRACLQPAQLVQSRFIASQHCLEMNLKISQDLCSRHPTGSR